MGGGACQGLLVEQVIPRHLREKCPFYPSLCVKVISSGKKRTKRAQKVEVSGSLMLITALRNDVSRPGKRLKTDPAKPKGIKEACQLNGAFFSVSLRIHLSPFNGIKVYPRRRVCIKYERFHLLLCIQGE